MAAFFLSARGWHSAMAPQGHQAGRDEGLRL
jgi:hypothetical protein